MAFSTVSTFRTRMFAVRSGCRQTLKSKVATEMSSAETDTINAAMAIRFRGVGGATAGRTGATGSGGAGGTRFDFFPLLLGFADIRFIIRPPAKPQAACGHDFGSAEAARVRNGEERRAPGRWARR